MDFYSLAKERYSVRKFDSAEIGAEVLDRLIDAALIAPTACNKQPIRIMAIHDSESLGILDKCTPCRYGAPLAFVIGYQSDLCWVRPYDGKSSGDIDASIVTTHVMLMAEELGLGSLWVMNFKPEELLKGFSFPDNFVPTAILMVGRAAADSVPNPRHNESIGKEQMLLPVKH